jgi:hypothetical protein
MHAFGRVIEVEPRSQARSLDPRDGVGPWIELLAAAEDLDADRVILQPAAAVGERLLHDEAEERLGAFSDLNVSLSRIRASCCSTGSAAAPSGGMGVQLYGR